MLHRNEVAELFRVGLDEANAVRQPENLCALPSHFERLLGQVNSSNLRAMTRESDRIGADAAANLEHSLAVPSLKLGEPRDVGLDTVFASFDFIEVLTGANHFG